MLTPIVYLRMDDEMEQNRNIRHKFGTDFVLKSQKMRQKKTQSKQDKTIVEIQKSCAN